ncbi:MAG: histidine--tRNA ligase [Ignavibacteriae bacterium]|nr:MAG: histidine--tRNA ligase [Ignavibacteriota bacterium]
MKFQKPKGTKDILPPEIHKWHFVEKVIRDTMDLYNFSEIRTPMFENTTLFKRGVGTETDIVGKEMYTFEDKSGNSITLKPEMTAPVARAFVEHNLASQAPIHKFFYITSMFRYEKPQEGRYREHTQFGAEVLGTNDVYSDIEIISLVKHIYNQVGVHNFKVKINSLGMPDDRRKYIELLINYLNNHQEHLSNDSKRRLVINPLRILDSKDPNDIEITEHAPKILEHLDIASIVRFEKVINGLTIAGIDYEVDFRLVRGFDYYTDTTFEFISEDLGSQNAIGGGGRYDKLVETIGGKPIPGIGFGSGIERMIMVADRNNFIFPSGKSVDVYFITLNEEAKLVAFKEILNLRKSGIKCEYDSLGRSFKAQMREANKMNSRFVYIIGDEEITKQKGLLKKMSDGSQTEISFNNIIENIK